MEHTHKIRVRSQIQNLAGHRLSLVRVYICVHVIVHACVCMRVHKCVQSVVNAYMYVCMHMSICRYVCVRM